MKVVVRSAVVHLLWLLACSGVLMVPVVAVAIPTPAGKVLMAVGDTSRVDGAGARSAIANGELVNSGDTLLTGADSRLQWRTNDGALFALRPNSEFRVDEYQYDASSNKGRSFFSLAKGGFRTLSGAIGKKNHADYKVTTPVVTLGIRGTHYVVQLCLAGAGAAAAAVCSGVAPGFYMGTVVGAVLLGNAAGNLQVGVGQFGFVRSLSSPPELLPVGPGMLFDTALPVGKGKSRGRRVAGSAGGPRPGLPPPPPPRLPKIGASPDDGVVNLSDASVPPPPEEDAVVVSEPATITTTEAPPPPPPVADSSAGQNSSAAPPPGSSQPTPPPPVPGVQATVFASGPLGPNLVHTNIAVVPVADVDAVGTDPNFGAIDLYDVSGPAVSVLDTGQDPVTGIFWGRYINGVFNVPGVDASGNTTPTTPFDNRSLHYVSGVTPGQVQLPITGTATYVLVGATSPTDNLGSTGTLGSAFLNADFTNQEVRVSLEINLNSSVWSVDNATVPLNALGGDFGGTVPVEIGFAGSSTQPITGSGEVAGFFSGGPVGTLGVPAGAGLSYSLNDGSIQTVSGVVAFKAQ